MFVVHRIASFWRNLTRKRRLEQDLADEVNSFVELSAAAKMRAGLSDAQARREAVVELGGVEQVKESVREARAGYFFERRLQDLRFAVRTLRKSPVFSVTVILVVGLGIGSTGLIFAIVHSLLLRGPDFPEADRLYLLWQKIPQEDRVSFSLKEFIAWRQRTHVFEELASYTGAGFTITGRGEPELLFGQLVTPSLFRVLQTRPVLGRAFLDNAAHSREVILSHDFWRRKFNGRRDVLGEQLQMNGELYTVVGVMAESFDFPSHEAKLWVPADLDASLFRDHPDAHLLRVIGRLKAGMSRDQLQAEVDLLSKQVDDPDDKTDRRYFAVSLKQMLAGDLRNPLLVLFTAVCFLLLIACANVANLMLARANARHGEISIRAALGASRIRLIAQLLTESLLLALAGGMVGLAAAVWGLDLVKRFAAATIPQLLHAHLDPIVVSLTILAGLVCGAIFGLTPAFAATADLADGLSGGSRSTSRATGIRQALVFIEIALACVLLVGCALMLRSFIALSGSDPGFNPDNLVIAQAGLAKDRYPDKSRMLQFYSRALMKIRALPGVSSAGVVTHLPFGGNSWGNSFSVEGRPEVTDSAQIRPVSPGYFGTMGIPLKKGRDFAETDNENAAGVAIVSDLIAKRYWPNENPIGRKIAYFRDWLTIVGVCGEIKHAALDETTSGTIYISYRQLPADAMQFIARDLNFALRTSQPAVVAMEARQALRGLDPQLVVKITTMEALIHDSIAQPRFRTSLIAMFGIFALGLACLGIYGVIAYFVSQRSREIGIRMALGATRANILQLVLGRTFRLAAAGAVAGLIAAFFLSQFLRAVLFGISVHDALTFAAVPVCLVSVALVAGYLPARRAANVDPVTSLRYE